MAAEELESAEFEWSFDNTSQLIISNLCETFPCLYDIRSKDYRNRDIHTQEISVGQLKCPSRVGYTCSTLWIWFYFLTIHVSKFCSFFVIS